MTKTMLPSLRMELEKSLEDWVSLCNRRLFVFKYEFTHCLLEYKTKHFEGSRHVL